MERTASAAPTLRPIAPGALGLWVHALSLDTVLAVVAAGWLVARGLSVTLPPQWWAVLALSCWGVYLVDHMLDAGRLGSIEPGRRRAPFVRARRAWWTLAGAALAVDLALAATLPRAILVAGSTVLPPLALHLWLAQRSSAIPKELTATLVYLQAIWIAPLTLAERPAGWLLPLLLAHGAAAFANLATISVIDAAEDRRERQPSLATRFGRPRSRGAAAAAAAVAIVAAASLGDAPAAARLVGWAFAAAALAPLLIVARSRLRAEAARSAADLSFVLLALLVAVALS